MKPGRLLLLFALIIIGIVIYINKCNNKNGPSPSAAGQGKQGPALQVSGIIVQPSVISDHLTTSGTLLANEEVEIRNEIAGRLVKINFAEGTHVNKGDLLIKIYDEDLQAQFRKLQLEKELAEKSESREKDLLSASGISQQDYDVALNRLNQAKADIDLVKAQISKTEIHAPFSGIIGLKSVSEGSFLALNTSIASIQETDPVKLEFSIPERYRGQISNQKEVKFNTASSKGTYTGKVYAFEPKVDKETRTIMVRALCPNADHALIPGAFAKVDVPLTQIDQALMVPSQAVIPELKGQKVFVCKNGKAVPLKVAIGLRNDSSVNVIDGLQIGDTVLITGIMQVRPGMDVKVNITR